MALPSKMLVATYPLGNILELRRKIVFTDPTRIVVETVASGAPTPEAEKLLAGMKHS
jgi:hypothetical protein